MRKHYKAIRKTNLETKISTNKILIKDLKVLSVNSVLEKVRASQKKSTITEGVNVSRGTQKAMTM